jgi:hypothetical protein
MVAEHVPEYVGLILSPMSISIVNPEPITALLVKFVFSIDHGEL